MISFLFMTFGEKNHFLDGLLPQITSAQFFWTQDPKTSKITNLQKWSHKETRSYNVMSRFVIITTAHFMEGCTNPNKVNLYDFNCSFSLLKYSLYKHAWRVLKLYMHAPTNTQACVTLSKKDQMTCMYLQAAFSGHVINCQECHTQHKSFMWGKKKKDMLWFAKLVTGSCVYDARILHKVIESNITNKRTSINMYRLIYWLLTR